MVTRDPAQDAVAAPRLSEAERRSLGCTCTRLDDVWHHVRFCPAPAVESILAARLAPIEAALRHIEGLATNQARACQAAHRADHARNWARRARHPRTRRPCHARHDQPRKEPVMRKPVLSLSETSRHGLGVEVLGLSFHREAAARGNPVPGCSCEACAGGQREALLGVLRGYVTDCDGSSGGHISASILPHVADALAAPDHASHQGEPGEEVVTYVEDGFGSEWPLCGPGCDLQVVRPGKVQCNRSTSTCPDLTGGGA